jgi:hypothetical protein
MIDLISPPLFFSSPMNMAENLQFFTDLDRENPFLKQVQQN